MVSELWSIEYTFLSLKLPTYFVESPMLMDAHHSWKDSGLHHTVVQHSYGKKAVCGKIGFLQKCFTTLILGDSSINFTDP